MIILSAAQVAALVVRVGFPDTPIDGVSTRAIIVAICRHESGYQVDALDPNSASGLFKIRWDDNQRYDQRRLLNDPEYNAQAAYEIYQARGLPAWSSYATGGYLLHLGEARLALAQAATVIGAPELPTASTITGVTGIGFGTPPSQTTSLGSVPANATAVADVFTPLRIIGSEMWGDYASLVIGATVFDAGIETIPNLRFTVFDPEGDLLFKHRNVFVQGSRVQYLDMDLRIDQIIFEPGGHGSGQLTIVAIHDIAYRLMKLVGAATASGISATQWLARELGILGHDPNVYMLGEAVTSQAQISRDAEDQAGSAGSAQTPSGWTTMVRLAQELGKRFFLSGSKIVFGSSAFAMRWCAYGSLRLSWHTPPIPGEQWLSMPSNRETSVGDRANVLEVTGRVPLERAKFFRPGVSVVVRNSPSIAGDEWREFICSHVSYTVGVDTDGAEITLLEPVDPPPRPPPPPPSPNAAATSAGTTVSGGGADGQVDRFVAIALQQAGKRYVFGAEASPSNPNPAAFDCSELVEWAAARAGINPRVPDGSAAQRAHCQSHGTSISVSAAVGTKGALLFGSGHVAISLGNGKTIEAMNPSAGVRQGNAAGRGWIGAGKIPGAQGYR
jgi:NlpC/P60 family